MSDEPPPLPSTNDPFALLGVTPDVDERALKRAYARMIKIYRPDRRPDEFARIQQAFEEVRFEIAVGNAPRGVHGDAAATREAAIASATLTWARLRSEEDPRVAHAAIRARLEHVAAGDDPGAVIDLLADEAFRTDAEASPPLAVAALEALAAIAWRDERAAATLERYRSLPTDPAVDEALIIAEAEVAAATAMRAPGVPSLPEPLAELLARRRALDPAARLALEQQLVRLLDDQPTTMLAALDRLVTAAPGAANALAELLYVGLPPRRRPGLAATAGAGGSRPSHGSSRSRVPGLVRRAGRHRPPDRRTRVDAHG
jgi:hypothetical protein